MGVGTIGSQGLGKSGPETVSVGLFSLIMLPPSCGDTVKEVSPSETKRTQRVKLPPGQGAGALEVLCAQQGAGSSLWSWGWDPHAESGPDLVAEHLLKLEALHIITFPVPGYFCPLQEDRPGGGSVQK